jgi:hypothetical protein
MTCMYPPPHMSSWLQALDLADDDAVLQDSALALGFALGLVPR